MMTNLLNGAHVANKLFSTIARPRLLLVMFLTLTVSAEVWGETYTMTIDQNGNKGKNNVHITNTSANSSQDVSYNDITWSVAWEGNGAPMQGGTTECQFGSSTNPCSMVTLSTSDIVGTITSIKINARGAKDNNAVVAVNVGGSTFTNGSNNSVSIGTADGDKELSGEAIGTIVITISQTTSKAIYIKSISVTYEEAATCTTNPTVSAGSNSSVTTTTATVSCSGGITSLGSAGCSITSYGFVYGTSSNPTISNTKVQVGTTYTTTGTAFSKELTGLTANTTYYVRPYATNGNGTAYGTQTSFKTLELPKYTVTLVPGSGSVTDTELEEESAGAGVTLPTPTLNGCGEWTFDGWKTTSAVTIETTTKPTLIAAGTYKPTSNITLYAVYKRTEGGGGGGESFILSLYYDNTTYYVGTKGSGSYLTATTEESDAVTFQYEDNKYLSYDDDGDKIYISSTSDNTTLTIGTTSPSVTWTETSADGKFTYQTSATGNRYLGFNNSASPKRFAPYASSYPHSFTKHLTSSTTYYHSTPECTTEPSLCLIQKEVAY